MKAIILAAGKGVRMLPLTYEVPKPMLRINNKPILCYTIESLPDEITEVIFVVGYLGDQIKSYFGDSFGGRKISYVEQKELLGTGHALKICEPFLNQEKFMVLMGDDFYAKDDLARCLKYDFCLLAKELSDPGRFGFLQLDETGHLERIIELSLEALPQKQDSYLIYTGACVLDYRFFSYELVKLKGKEEFGLPQTIVKLAVDYPVMIEKASFWIPVGKPEDLAKVARFLNKE